MYLAGFIGTGNMGGALAKAAAKSIGGERIVLADHSAEKAGLLAEETGACVKSAAEAAAESKYIFLGVKPQALAALAEEIAPVLKKRRDGFVIVTMAAGKSIESISEILGAVYPTVRIMPNTPVSIGKGVVLYCANSLVGDIEEFLSIMKYAGELDELPERLIDAGCSVSGCGPAWVYMFIEALADGGVMCGLPRDKAVLYACDTLIGSAELVKATKKHCGLLKDEVCSPGGTTIAGVKALEDNAFRGSVMGAVEAAYKKTLELKK